jgi:hypothetical protein
MLETFRVRLFLNLSAAVVRIRTSNLLEILERLTYVHDNKHITLNTMRGRRGRDRMVVGFMTIYAISAYHH